MTRYAVIYQTMQADIGPIIEREIYIEVEHAGQIAQELKKINARAKLISFVIDGGDDDYLIVPDFCF